MDISIPELIRLLTMATVVALMMSIGLQVPPRAVLTSLARLGVVMRALALNFIVVPTLVTVVVWATGMPWPVAVGMLISAASAGAPLAPPLSSLARGDVALAIGLMVILAGVAAFLTPAICAWGIAWLAGGMSDGMSDGLGADMGASAAAEFSIIPIVVMLGQSMLAPLGVGFVVQAAMPSLARRLIAPMRMFGNLLLVAGIVLIFAAQWESMRVLDLDALAIILLCSLTPFALGYIAGGQHPAEQKTMAITAGVRNTALALLIAASQFAGTAVVTVVMIAGFIMVTSGLVSALVLRRGALAAA